MDTGCEKLINLSSYTLYLTANQVLQLITPAVLCELQITSQHPASDRSCCQDENHYSSVDSAS